MGIIKPYKVNLIIMLKPRNPTTETDKCKLICIQNLGYLVHNPFFYPEDMEPGYKYACEFDMAVEEGYYRFEAETLMESLGVKMRLNNEHKLFMVKYDRMGTGILYSGVIDIEMRYYPERIRVSYDDKNILWLNDVEIPDK